MKKLFIGVCALFLASSLAAQHIPATEIPYIEVTGSADIEIEPDEMRLSITISSFKYEETGHETSLETTEKKLMKILEKAGIEKKNIILKSAATQGYWYYWWRYDRDDDPRMTKQYEVIFSDYAALNTVLAELPGPKEGFVNVNISDLKNKKITEYRKQTKIEAIKAAKEKAQYLLESVGSTAGQLIQVIELDEDDYGWYRPYAASNAISQTSLRAGNGGDDSNSSMQKIKLRYRIKARFEIR